MSARKLMMEELKSIIEVYPPFQQKLKFLKSIGQGYSISLTRDVTSDSTKETDSTAETRSVGMLNEAASASTFPNQSHNSELTILDDFPKTVGWNLEPGSSPTTVDFHPIQQNLLRFWSKQYVFEGHEAPVYSICSHVSNGIHFGTSKNKFLAAGDEQLIKVWDMNNVELLATIDVDGELVLTVNPTRIAGGAGAIDGGIPWEGSLEKVVLWDSIRWKKKKNRMLQKSVGWLPPSETYLQFYKDETHFLAVHDTHLAIYETTELKHVNQQDVRNNLTLVCARRSWNVYPFAVAAHPRDPNQIALGLTDSGVVIIHHLESDGQWDLLPPVDNETASGSPVSIISIPILSMASIDSWIAPYSLL
ncbi:hypothetical protein LguiA_030318 [Lonicera macranthoides]